MLCSIQGKFFNGYKDKFSVKIVKDKILLNFLKDWCTTKSYYPDPFDYTKGHKSIKM